MIIQRCTLSQKPKKKYNDGNPESARPSNGTNFLPLVPASSGWPSQHDHTAKEEEKNKGQDLEQEEKESLI
jgi:hypothetical protein